jgi:cytochrome c
MIKKMFAAIAITTVLLSCGGDSNKSEEEKPATETTTEDLSSNPVYKEGLELVSTNDCLTCHKVSEKLTGPAYADVAAKYPDAADTTITRLAQTIIKGGSGQWGTIPMTAHAGLSEDDAKKMVKYILLLKK